MGESSRIIDLAILVCTRASIWSGTPHVSTLIKKSVQEANKDNATREALKRALTCLNWTATPCTKNRGRGRNAEFRPVCSPYSDAYSLELSVFGVVVTPARYWNQFDDVERLLPDQLSSSLHQQLADHGRTCG